MHPLTCPPNKPMKTTPLLLTLATLTLPLAALAEGASPWLPIPGEVAISLNLSQQSGDTAYVGSTELPLSAITGGGASKYKRSTTTLRLAYGLSDAVALDASLGRGSVKVGGADNSSGAVDSTAGVSWRVLDEYERSGLPTVTLRAGAIFKGSYDGARLAALGNAANGYELSLAVGKQLTSAFSLSAEAGVQERSNSVPKATFFELGARYRVLPALSVSLGYTDKKYAGNLDIGGPGFSPARFQQVRAERSITKLGIGYAITGNQGIALSLAKVGSGRNTVKDDSIAGLSYTFAF